MISRLLYTLLLCPLATYANTDNSAWSFKGMAELQIPATDSEISWLERGLGSFRYDQDDDGKLQIGTSGVAATYRFNLESIFYTTLLYNSEPNHKPVVTEAFWHYRPTPKSAWRQEYKVGGFYPGFSLENSGPLWTSPYSLTPSVINSWYGEEVRTIGGEIRWLWQDPQRRSPHRFGITTGLFLGNDTAGVLLPWRGWANNDRQTGLRERLPLIDLPNRRPGGQFSGQADVYEPFVEVDGRPGLYFGVDWQYERDLKIMLHYYDNRAEPSAFKQGQYGWHTEFLQIALKWQPIQQLEIISQYLFNGSTQMNNTFNTVLVLNDFSAAFIALSHTKNNHRLTYRWEKFEVDDIDNTFMDSNDQLGHSFTLSYSYSLQKHWKVTVEGIRRKDEIMRRHYFGSPALTTEKQLLLSLRRFY